MHVHSLHVDGSLREAKTEESSCAAACAKGHDDGAEITRLHQSMGLEPALGKERWPALDLMRGLAIAAMVVYHFAWDLSSVRLIATDIVGHPAWQFFARAIAASFLTLVGVGLHIAHGDKLRWRAFFRRLAIIAGAALVVTLVTWWAMPRQYIFFGILHCIAVSSVLALPFLRAPVGVLAGATALCFAAPFLFTGPALDAPVLDWLGLGAQAPVTNDYVPIFPWFGFVLLGLAVGRRLRGLALHTPSGSAGRANPVVRALVWSGRRSLIIYLVHQPLLLGALGLLVRATGPNPAAEAAVFTRECEASCLASRAERTVCTAGCACAVERLKAEGFWPQALAANPDPAEQARLSATFRQCFRSNPGRVD